MSGDVEGANESGTELLARQEHPGGCGRRFVGNHRSAVSSLCQPLRLGMVTGRKAHNQT